MKLLLWTVVVVVVVVVVISWLKMLIKFAVLMARHVKHAKDK